MCWCAIKGWAFPTTLLFPVNTMFLPACEVFQCKCTGAMKDNWIKNDVSTNENDVWKNIESV